MKQTIFDIDEAIYSLIDEETGEISDITAFEKLSMERDKKIENTLMLIKELKAEANALKEEIDNLKKRKDSAENLAERLKYLMFNVLNGEKFKTAKVAVSYRKSESVKVDDDFIEWAKKHGDDLLTYAEPKPSLTKIKDALNNGREIPFAKIEEKNNIVIK